MILNYLCRYQNFIKKLKKIVTADFDYNAVPAKLTVVPSIKAHDIIEMEEIERDLGF
jgi:hypothetical protein